MEHYCKKDISSVLLDAETIRKRVKELGDRISQDYQGKELVAVCILRGCVVFFADLMRAISIPMTIDFLAVSSYGSGSVSGGNVMIKYDMQDDIQGKHLLIVEDIIDTGYTLNRLLEMLRAREPASIEVCCLLSKPDRREVEVPVKYIGFEIPDEFVVGYGLDYDSKYRNFDCVGILKREMYE